MTTIDRDLVGALKTARQKPMRFVLVLKAPGEGTLIVSKNPISAAAIAQAKQELGGGQVVKGRCSGGSGGELVFETAKEPVANLDKTIRAVIKRDAGLTLKVETRRANDLLDEEDEAKAPEAAVRELTEKIDGLKQEIKRAEDLSKTLPTKYDQMDPGQQEKGLGDWAKAKSLDRFPRFLMALDWGRDAKFIVGEFLRDGAPSSVVAKLKPATRSAILSAQDAGQKPDFTAARKEILGLVDQSLMPAYVKDTRKGMADHIGSLKKDLKAQEGKRKELVGR